MGANEQITEIEEQLKKVKYNKHTQFGVGLMKAKLSRLREEITKKSGGKKGQGYSVKKSGDATVVLLGFPSVGKSTLLNKITGAESEVGAYDFTTLDVIPGLLDHKHAQIQILDVPGIVSGAASGRGRGREVLAVIRSSDLILIIIDALKPEQYHSILAEVFEAGVRLDQRKPDVKVVRKTRGGISLSATCPLTKINKETIEGILREYRLSNCDVVIREDITDDQLIDVLDDNRSYVKSCVVVNKIDLVSANEAERLQVTLKPDLLISANTNMGIEELKEVIYGKIGFIRIFCKESGKKADLDAPLIMRHGATLEEVCRRLHKDFVRKFRFARIWGPSAKFDGQTFRDLKKELRDGDIVELKIVHENSFR
ncbi:GTP-binding protein [Candidatus Woesearchaeota archaeon]|nr:GTP-binding protein [Candidatus Woesearchaeota archaeon]